MSDVKITVRPNGPYLVTGEVEVVNGAGDAIGTGGKQTFALCRCGHSASKPFCDGSHAVEGFQAD